MDEKLKCQIEWDKGHKCKRKAFRVLKDKDNKKIPICDICYWELIRD